jgi:nitroreductase
MTLTAAEVHHLKQADTTAEVLEVLRRRWSPRAFTDREVSTADLRTIFEAARWAPSSNNEQPWRFMVAFRGSETYQKIGSALVEFNQLWALKAPVLILGMSKKHFSRNNSDNPYHLYDLGTATGYITLQAAALGLATHQMAGFDRNAARTALGIPEEFEIGSVMAVGYQGDPSTLPNEKMIGQETAPRTRKPLSEFVLDAWDQPAKLG